MLIVRATKKLLDRLDPPDSDGGLALLAAVEGDCGRRALLYFGAVRQGVRRWLRRPFG